MRIDGVEVLTEGDGAKAIVMIHGWPDTHRLWDKLRSRISRRDVLVPSLPGFGVPTPPGFRSTKEAYVEWLNDRGRAYMPKREILDLLWRDLDAGNSVPELTEPAELQQPHTLFGGSMTQYGSTLTPMVRMLL